MEREWGTGHTRSLSLKHLGSGGKERLNKYAWKQTINRNRVSALRENNRVGESGRDCKRGQRDWPALGALEWGLRFILSARESNRGTVKLWVS